MFWGVEAYPKEFTSVLNVEIAHRIGLPLSIKVDVQSQNGTVSRQIYKIKEANFMRLIFILRLVPGTRSVRINLPRGGLSTYTTPQHGEFLISESEVMQDLKTYLGSFFKNDT